jgi:hypothetical protein
MSEWLRDELAVHDQRIGHQMAFPMDCWAVTLRAPLVEALDLSLWLTALEKVGYRLGGQSVEVMKWNLTYSMVHAVVEELWAHHRRCLFALDVRRLTRRHVSKAQGSEPRGRCNLRSLLTFSVIAAMSSGDTAS